MSDDIEAIKARAKARAKAASKSMEIAAPQPEPSMGQKILAGGASRSAMGPIGFMSGAADAYYNEVNKLIKRGAYKAGGAVADMAANAGASPEVAGGAGYLTNVGIQSIPVIVSAIASNKLLAGPIEKSAKRVMQSAIKPSGDDLLNGKAARAIDTMLDEGINVSEGGMAKLRAKIIDLNDEIATALKDSNSTVRKPEVGRALLEKYNEFKKQVNPNADLESVRKAWLEFRNHPLLAGKQDIPVQLAQELKQGTYKQLNKKYGQLGSADDEAQKALARGLKEEIAKKIPGIQGLNDKESDLLNALSVAERRVLVGLNNNPAGLSLLANSPSKMAAFMADRSALFKSLVARMLHSGAGPISTGLGAGAAGAATVATQKPQN